jgi:hypothetical protein
VVPAVLMLLLRVLTAVIHCLDQLQPRLVVALVQVVLLREERPAVEDPVVVQLGLVLVVDLELRVKVMLAEQMGPAITELLVEVLVQQVLLVAQELLIMVPTVA